MWDSRGFLVGTRQSTDAPTQSHVASSTRGLLTPAGGGVGGGSRSPPQEAPGGRSRPPGEMNDFKSWVEMLMEDRRFKGKIFFLETRICEEAYWPQFLFKEIFPFPHKRDPYLFMVPTPRFSSTAQGGCVIHLLMPT